MCDPEVHSKRRAALLSYYKGDPAAATKYLDLEAEWIILMNYAAWASFENEHREEKKNTEEEERKEEEKRKAFFQNLYEEILEDVYAVDPELGACGVFVRKHPDGTFVAEPFDYVAARDGPDARKDESLSPTEEDGDCCVEEEQKKTSTAEEIASFQMEEDVSFSQAATLMPHICEQVTDATPLLYRQYESNSTQEENLDTSPLSVIMCGCQCS